MPRPRSGSARLHSIFLVLSLLVPAGCGDDTVTEVGTNALSGAWSGALEDDQVGDGTISLAISQSGSSVSGSWSMAFPGASFQDLEGSLSGFLSGSTMTATLSVSPSTACRLTLTGILAGSAQSTIAGGYDSEDCDPERTGSFVVTRQ